MIVVIVVAVVAATGLHHRDLDGRRADVAGAVPGGDGHDVDAVLAVIALLGTQLQVVGVDDDHVRLVPVSAAVGAVVVAAVPVAEVTVVVVVAITVPPLDDLHGERAGHRPAVVGGGVVDGDGHQLVVGRPERGRARGDGRDHRRRGVDHGHGGRGLAGGALGVGHGEQHGGGPQRVGPGR